MKFLGSSFYSLIQLVGVMKMQVDKLVFSFGFSLAKRGGFALLTA